MLHEAHTSRDRRLLFATAGLRATAAGLSGVLLGVHLAGLGWDAGRIGVAVSLGLAGAAAGTLGAMVVADRCGRRATLAAVGGLIAAGGIVYALASQASWLLAAAFLGMLNGMGRDRGAGLTLEQAMLPQTTTDARRTTAFAWYNVAVDTGHALGALLGGVPALLRGAGWATPEAARTAWLLYAALGLGSGLLALRLSSLVEDRETRSRTPLSPATRRIVARFAALSGLDSLGGGFLTTALVGYWFLRRFGVDEGVLAWLFFASRLANGLSHLGAAWLARRIGLVNTMVWTHLPSSLLLMTVPFAPNLPVAIVLFLVRESLVEMDVPTRQSYIVAVVRPEERLRAAGFANLTRAVSWAAAPAVAGFLMRSVALGSPLLVGPGLKIAYDMLLWRAFRGVKPPEEAPT